MQIGRSFRGLPQSPRRALDRRVIPVRGAGFSSRACVRVCLAACSSREVLVPQFVDRMPTYPITVELPVHQKLSLLGREPAKTRHPLSRALNEVATAQSAVVLEPLKARNSGNLGTDKMGMGMPGTRMPGPDRPYWQRHRRRWHPPRLRRRRRPNLPRNKRLRSHRR